MLFRSVTSITLPDIIGILIPVSIFWLYRKSGNLFTAAVGAWLLLGWAYDYAVYHVGMGLSAGYVALVYVKHLFNLVFDVLAATAILRLLPARWRAGQAARSLRTTVFDDLTVWALPITLLVGLLYCRSELGNALRQAELEQQAKAAEVAARVEGHIRAAGDRLATASDRVIQARPATPVGFQPILDDLMAAGVFNNVGLEIGRAHV